MSKLKKKKPILWESVSRICGFIYFIMFGQCSACLFKSYFCLVIFFCYGVSITLILFYLLLFPPTQFFFHCTAWGHSYTYMCTLFFLTLSCSIISDQTQFPVLHSRISLLIHSKGNSLDLLTPCSPTTPLPPPSPLETTNQFCKSTIFFSVQRFICALYQIPDINDIIWYLSFSF